MDQKLPNTSETRLSKMCLENKLSATFHELSNHVWFETTPTRDYYKGERNVRSAGYQHFSEASQVAWFEDTQVNKENSDQEEYKHEVQPTVTFRNCL